MDVTCPWGVFLCQVKRHWGRSVAVQRRQASNITTVASTGDSKPRRKYIQDHIVSSTACSTRTSCTQYLSFTQRGPSTWTRQYTPSRHRQISFRGREACRRNMPWLALHSRSGTTLRCRFIVIRFSAWSVGRFMLLGQSRLNHAHMQRKENRKGWLIPTDIPWNLIVRRKAHYFQAADDERRRAGHTLNCELYDDLWCNMVKYTESRSHDHDSAKPPAHSLATVDGKNIQRVNLMIMTSPASSPQPSYSWCYNIQRNCSHDPTSKPRNRPKPSLAKTARQFPRKSLIQWI